LDHVLFHPFRRASPQDALWRLHPIISRSSSKNRRLPLLKDKSIGLIKWQKAGLENLLGSPYLKRRI
jgi:hypothetical protein